MVPSPVVPGGEVRATHPPVDAIQRHLVRCAGEHVTARTGQFDETTVKGHIPLVWIDRHQWVGSACEAANDGPERRIAHEDAFFERLSRSEHVTWRSGSIAERSKHLAFAPRETVTERRKILE
ncbi:MAG TPA: hypothetical protein VNJ03_00810, partial [Vicinamibacterales bacterium]|nr:hypothetical protein [Vicinamibacterales bacterium]